jgi:hypothetical protein
LRTAEEKEWLGMDIVHRPSAYAAVSLAEADEMRYDGGYACKLSPADVARVSQLPRRVTLALPFLHTPAELRAHELLCRYSAGLHSDHYKVLDAESGDPAAARHSATDDPSRPAAAAAVVVVQGAVAAPQQQQQQQQQQLLCRRRAVEALSKPPADRSWSEAAWCAVDSLLRPDFCARSDAPSASSTYSTTDSTSAATGAGAADVSDMYDDDGAAVVVVADTSAAESAAAVATVPDELQSSIRTELLKRGLTAEALRAVLHAVERSSSTTTSSSSGVNGVLTLLPHTTADTATGQASTGVSRVPIGPETFETALHAALARHWCTEQHTVLGKDAAANVAPLDALAVSLAADNTTIPAASVTGGTSTDTLQLSNSTAILAAGSDRHSADVLAITHSSAAAVDSSATNSGTKRVSTTVSSAAITAVSSVTEPPIVCATLADVATLNPSEARRRGVLIDCCGLTTISSTADTNDVGSVEAERTLLDISRCELSAGECCVHKFDVQGLVLQIVVTVIFQVSVYFGSI